MEAALTSAGVIVLLALAVDLTLTLFSPFGHHGGPVHRFQNRLIWFAFRSTARVMGAKVRPQVLSLAGPVGVLSTVLLWSGWLIGAFALVYLPHLDSFRMLTPTASPPWLDAVYYSGYVASTLGLGDVVAISPTMRAVTVVEAVAGFTLFAVSTTYALTVTREAGLAAALAAEIGAFRRVTEDVLPGESDDVGADWSLEAIAGRKAETWAAALQRITDGHRQYPLLHFFRPTVDERSLLVHVGWLVNVLEPVAEGHLFPPLPERLLAEAVDGYLAGLNAGCVPATFSPLPEVGVSRHDRHMRLLLHLGYHDPTEASGEGC